MRAPSHAGVMHRVTRVTMLTAAAAYLSVVACATPRGGDGAADSANTTPDASAASPGGAAGTPAGEAAPAPGGRAQIVLELDRTRYAPGSTVNVRIINRDDAGYGFNGCQRQVERRRGGQWVTVPEEGRICTMMLQLVGARQTVMVATELPAGMEAGEYRIAITFSREEGPAPGPDVPASAPPPIRAVSAAFRVE